MNKDINLIELKEAIGEEGIKDLLRYIKEVKSYRINAIAFFIIIKATFALLT